MIDFKTLTLTWKPNQFLVLPAGYPAAAKPHRASPVFAATPAEILAALKAVALAEPRTSVLSEGPGKLELVQRSKLFRFPDFVTVESVAMAPGRSALAIYSRAKLGIRDFGVNRARIERWLAAIEAKLPKT